MSDGENFNVLETDEPFAQKMDFASNVMRQVERINTYLSKLYETPAYVWMSYGKADTNFQPETIQPYVDNFVESVESLSIMLESHIDDIFKKDQKNLDVLRKKKIEKMKKDSRKKLKRIEKVNLAKKRYRNLIALMARKNLLPVQILD